MSFAASCVSAFFYAFLRLKLLQKEHFLNFQKSVHSEAILTGEKLQKTAHLEWSGMIWAAFVSTPQFLHFLRLALVYAI